MDRVNVVDTQEPPTRVLARTGGASARGLLIFIFAASTLFAQTHWIESTLQDFRDGELDPSMYIARRALPQSDSGSVQLFASFDANCDGKFELVTSSYGTVRLLYGPDYSVNNCSSFVTGGGSGNCDLADLNGDGYPDLIHSCGQVYWGTPNGPTAANPTILPVLSMEAVYATDLDRDGYMDLVFASIDGYLDIYWGSINGIHVYDTTKIITHGSLTHNVEIADFNKDGWGDIALSDRYNDSNPILYWGPERTYTVVRLPYIEDQSHGISVADLDGNGWLDIVYTGLYSATASYIYWGTPDGFSPACRTIVNPGECYGGSAVFDFNKDGWLDIVYYRGGPMGANPGKPIIYYNKCEAPYFGDGYRGEIGTPLGASGGFVADLDFDGNGDIFVNAYDNGSRIMWGPDFTRVTPLPETDDHHGAFRELGNIYDRSFSGFYFSSVYDAGDGNRVMAGASSWVAVGVPGGSEKMLFRSGDTPTPDETWTQFAEVPANGGAIPPACLGGRYLQYKVVLVCGHPCSMPKLEQVDNDLTISSAVAEPIGPSSAVGMPTLAAAPISVVPVSVRYSLPLGVPARIRIMDAAGHFARELLRGRAHAGAGELTWDGRDARGHRVSDGIYFVHLETPGFRVARKVILR
jgi:hypothetical protein